MIRQAKPTVAVMDDDRRVLESLADLLESAGYEVRAFLSAAAFLAGSSLHSIDCMISDVSMPGMNGLELERFARRERPDLPVVLITGHEDTWDQVQSVQREDPSRLLFRKPIDGEALLAAIAKAIAGKATPPA